MTEIEVLRTPQNRVWIKIDKGYIYIFILYLIYKGLTLNTRTAASAVPHTFLSTQTLEHSNKLQPALSHFLLRGPQSFCTSEIK